MPEQAKSVTRPPDLAQLDRVLKRLQNALRSAGIEINEAQWELSQVQRCTHLLRRHFGWRGAENKCRVNRQIVKFRRNSVMIEQVGSFCSTAHGGINHRQAYTDTTEIENRRQYPDCVGVSSVDPINPT